MILKNATFLLFEIHLSTNYQFEPPTPYANEIVSECNEHECLHNSTLSKTSKLLRPVLCREGKTPAELDETTCQGTDGDSQFEWKATILLGIKKKMYINPYAL